MKATALLRQQHDEVRALFTQIEDAPGHPKRLLERLADMLAAHMVIEQELFYPALVDVKAELVLESYEEHAVARFALKRLMKTDPFDRTFKARLATLKEIVENHVTEEEEELLPSAEKALGLRSNELYKQMQELFERTLRIGYSHIVGRGGEAVLSGHAPDAHV